MKGSTRNCRTALSSLPARVMLQNSRLPGRSVDVGVYFGSAKIDMTENFFKNADIHTTMLIFR